MTFGRVAEALPQAIGCVSWQKLVKSFFFFFELLLLILIVWCTPLTMMSPVRLLGSRFDIVTL